MSTKNKLETLISALEKVNDNPEKKELGDIISLLKAMAADPQVRAEIKKNDNMVSDLFLSIIGFMEKKGQSLVNHPKNQALKEFGRKLKPTQITDVPDFILEMFSSTIMHEPRQKPSI